jgi:uncharacterized DUF497 family protein
MAFFSWDPRKNEKLIQERGISFEAIVWSIEVGGLLEALEHPNPEKYPGQGLFVVRAQDYVYLVPFLEKGAEIRLITIIPSRKAYKKHIERGQQDEA